MSIKYYIYGAKEVFQREGYRKLCLETTRRLYELIIPPDLDMKVSNLRYKYSGHTGIGNPFRIYMVNPQEIKSVIQRKDLERPKPRFGIIDGDWHEQATVPHRELPTHQMLVEHFEYGKNWGDTDHYTEICDIINRGELYWRMDSKNQDIRDFHNYLEYLDDLFKSIRDEGYKKQSNLSSEDDYLNRNINPYLNEIQVFIGPEGDYYLSNGGHRLTMAKILNLDKIPVRTCARHSRWQTIRNEIAENDDLSSIKKEYKQYLKHPEIQDLI